MLFLLILTILTVSGMATAAAEDKKTDVYNIMKTASFALPMMDAFITHRALDMGRAEESNPFMRGIVSSPLSVPLVGGVSLLSNWLTDKAWDKDMKWLAYGLQGLRILMSGLAIANNLKYLKEK